MRNLSCFGGFALTLHFVWPESSIVGCTFNTTAFLLRPTPHTGLAALEPRDESSTDADTTSLKRSALLAFRGRKDSCCVSALQGESQDFFQTAWDRHISHLREATRASVLASIVDIGGSGNSSAARPNSRSTTSPAVVVPHSVIDGTAFNDSSCDSYPASPHANSPRQKNEGLMRVEVTSPRRPLRFSMPTKYSQTPAVLQVDSTTERKTEEASDHGRLSKPHDHE
ncbi:hypothetical protein EGR_01345 [Echinococcus granulosus]|uniref:Uncharacterized protein n=1 Tax=Echinococcus granulosus TaxID=6210 RepID=W6UYK0_ECHGR|nr:hypothetical protein EGR_01345 [Echinococcus granulosus]EUB63722.1 hypothetical protein EGR_01345 [Echinococcus granulosus]